MISGTPRGLFLFLGGLFLWLVFLFHFDGACAIDGTELAKAALAKSAFFLELRLRLNGEPRPGNRSEPGFGNRFAGQLAFAVSILLNSFEGLFNLVNRILIG